MESSLKRLQKVKRAKQKLNEIFQNRKSAFLLHYSCESFVDNTKASHKVTSIAVRNLESAQTHSFSIFQCAEEMNLQGDIEVEFKQIEKELLNKYFSFVGEHKSAIWVHWNMRDINYGFAALEHRYRYLGGNPVIIDDERKFDLPRILCDRYGKNFAPHPRLENVIKLNEITDRNFLTGKEESEAFMSGDYLKLHQSTLRKVDIFESILSQIEENDFKVSSSIMDIYGLSANGIIRSIRDHWFFSLLSLLILSVAVAEFVEGFFENFI